MSVLDREAFFEAVQKRVGEDTSDEAIQFIEDMTDTYNDIENRAAGDGVDWEARYKELDETWKRKYAHRFFSGPVTVRNEQTAIEEDEEENRENITYKDLFEEG